MTSAPVALISNGVVAVLGADERVGRELGQRTRRRAAPGDVRSRARGRGDGDATATAREIIDWPSAPVGTASRCGSTNCSESDIRGAWIGGGGVRRASPALALDAMPAIVARSGGSATLAIGLGLGCDRTSVGAGTDAGGRSGGFGARRGARGRRGVLGASVAVAAARSRRAGARLRRRDCRVDGSCAASRLSAASWAWMPSRSARRQVDLDLAREIVLTGEQERAIRLGVATGARVREAEVADGAALARIERAAGLERADRLVGVAELEVDEPEVQPVRRVGRRALDELLVDRARLRRTGRRGSASGRAARARAGSRRRARARRETRLRFVELALLEQLAAARDGLIDGLAIECGTGHQRELSPRLAALSRGRRCERSTASSRRRDGHGDRAVEVGARDAGARRRASARRRRATGTRTRSRRPHEMTASVGRVAATSAGDDDVGLPWCGDLDDIGVPTARRRRRVLALGLDVAGEQQRAAGVARS